MTGIALVALAAAGGMAAGIITCLAGVGGGIVLIVLLSSVLPAPDVVALTAPVFLIGNLDRAWLFRGDVDRSIAPWFAVGAVPAATMGSVVLGDLPASMVQTGIAVVVLTFVTLRLLPRGRNWRVAVPMPAFIAVGALNGGVSAVAGGGGLMTAPFLHAHGLSRGSFVGTDSLFGVIINLIKTLVYLVSGLLVTGDLWISASAALAMAGGNRVGRRLLRTISPRVFERLLLAVLTVAGIRLLVNAVSAGP